MKAIYFIIFLVWVSLSACSQQASRTGKKTALPDTLFYTYKTIKKRAGNCGNKADSECTIAKIKYPVFVNRQKLNDSVQNKLLQQFSFGEDQKNNTSFNQLAESVITSYKADTSAIRNGMTYTLDIAANVRRQDSGVVVMQIGGYTFSGGAHGSTEALFLNWDIRADKKIALDDIFITGYRQPLNKIAEKIFRSDEKLGDTASLATNYFFDKGKFSLNNNFMITPKGISFLYNEYEIKPYAEGQTTLFIPYAQIKPLIRRNSVVSQYLK